MTGVVGVVHTEEDLLILRVFGMIAVPTYHNASMDHSIIAFIEAPIIQHNDPYFLESYDPDARRKKNISNQDVTFNCGCDD